MLLTFRPSRGLVLTMPPDGPNTESCGVVLLMKNAVRGSMPGMALILPLVVITGTGMNEGVRSSSAFSVARR